MNTPVTWLVRDDNDVLHRREVALDDVPLVLSGLLEDRLEAQLARLIDLPTARSHAPHQGGLMFIDLHQRLVLNATDLVDLSLIPYVSEPAAPDAQGWAFTMQRFMAHKRVKALILAVRGKGSSDTITEQFDPFLGPNEAADQPSMGERLEAIVAEQAPSAQVSLDPRYGTSLPTVRITLSLSGISDAIINGLVKRLNDDPACTIVGMDLRIDIAPFQTDALPPSSDRHAWLFRLSDRLSDLDVEFTHADNEAWDTLLQTDLPLPDMDR